MTAPPCPTCVIDRMRVIGNEIVWCWWCGTTGHRKGESTWTWTPPTAHLHQRAILPVSFAVGTFMGACIVYGLLS